MNNKFKKIIIATGGTGGHVFPAYSLAKHFIDSKKINVEIISDKRGLKYLKDYQDVKIIEITSSTIFKKNIIHRMGFYPTHLQGHSEDTFLWLKLLHHNYTLHNLDDIILTYRDCPHSLSHNFKYDVKKDILNMDIIF